MTAMQYFFLGATSIFSFDRVHFFSFDETDIEKDIKNIYPFDNDADAIRHDFENVGRDIQKAIESVVHGVSSTLDYSLRPLRKSLRSLR